MWSIKTEGNLKLLQWKVPGITGIYDESALRKTMANFLSDDSRKRYKRENFMDEAEYLKGLEWFMDGFKLLLDEK